MSVGGIDGLRGAGARPIHIAGRELHRFTSQGRELDRTSRIASFSLRSSSRARPCDSLDSPMNCTLMRQRPGLMHDCRSICWSCNDLEKVVGNRNELAEAVAKDVHAGLCRLDGLLLPRSASGCVQLANRMLSRWMQVCHTPERLDQGQAIAVHVVHAHDDVPSVVLLVRYPYPSPLRLRFGQRFGNLRRDGIVHRFAVQVGQRGRMVLPVVCRAVVRGVNFGGKGRAELRLDAGQGNATQCKARTPVASLLSRQARTPIHLSTHSPYGPSKRHQQQSAEGGGTVRPAVISCTRSSPRSAPCRR